MLTPYIVRLSLLHLCKLSNLLKYIRSIRSQMKTVIDLRTNDETMDIADGLLQEHFDVGAFYYCSAV